MGQDLTPVYEGFEDAATTRSFPLRQTPPVTAGKQRPPVCKHGEWTFAGLDVKRQASK
jgi:hypothetical protein